MTHRTWLTHWGKGTFLAVLIACLATASSALATSYHTLTIDGTNDFAADEDFATSSAGYTAYFTWNASDLYLGYTGYDVNSGQSSAKWIVWFFDTDPQATPSSGTGTTTAPTFNTQNWTLPFSANYLLQIRTDGGYTALRQWNGSAWVNATFNGAVNDSNLSNFVEVRLPRGDLGNPNYIYTVGYFVNEQGGGEWTYASWPNTSLNGGDGYKNPGAFNHWYGYYLGNTISPDAASNTDQTFTYRVTNTNTSEQFATIQAAIDDSDTAAGHVIAIGPGTYTETVNVNKGVTLQPASTPPIVQGPCSTALINITAANVTIDGLNLKVNQSTCLKGISASGAYGGLTVKNNLIQSTATSGPGMIFTSYGIDLTGAVTTGVNVVNNTVVPETLTSQAFGRGLHINGAYGTIGANGQGNTISAYYAIQAAGATNGALDIRYNTLNGQNELNALLANVTHHFEYNTCASGDPGTGTLAPNIFALLEVKNVNQVPLNIEHNTFGAYTNFGVFLGRSDDVRIGDNTFTPLNVAAATNYRHIHLNTKERTTGTEAALGLSPLIIEDNVFNGNGYLGGVAIEFANHHSGATPAFQNVTIGSAGHENTFEDEVQTAIRLDPLSGNSSSLPMWSAPTCPGCTAITMAPVTDNFNAANNYFVVAGGTKLPAAMTLAELAQVEDRIVHKIDYATLGLVTVQANNAYVTPNSYLTGYTSSPSIQRGIDAVSAGDTVNVAAGTYANDLIIDKSLTLLGPNAAINPNTGTRVAEAVIIPATSDPDPNNDTAVTNLYIDANNVTVRGFTFDGDNPDLTSGILIGTADVDACEAIGAYGGRGGLVLENNIIQNNTYAGVDFYNYYNSGGATSSNYLRYNLLRNIGETTYNWGIGILIYNNFYADITDNVFDNVRVGLQTGNYSQANPGTTGSISNNTINAWRLGIFHNLWYATASTISISGNTINAVSNAGASRWNGMLISSQQGAVNTTLANNTINIGAIAQNPAAGYNVWNTPTSAPLTISGGAVNGGQYGVWVNNYAGYNGNASNTAITIDGVSLTGASTAAAYVQDDVLNTNGATVRLTLQNSTLSGAPVGVWVEGADATAIVKGNTLNNTPTAFSQSGGALTAYANTVTNYTTGLNQASGTANLKHNWWGTYSTQPAGVSSADWQARLGAPIQSWAEGNGSVTHNGAALSGGTGTAVIVDHGAGAAGAPFGNGVEPYVSSMCSSFFDIFLESASGTWAVTVPVSNTANCNTNVLTPGRLYWIPVTTTYSTACAPASNPACWTRVTGVTSGVNSLTVSGLSVTDLGGTQFVAGDPTRGADPTSITLKEISATSDRAVWPIGLSVAAVALALSSALVLHRRRIR